MSVKTIFKTLIGTLVILVIASVCIELFNINITGMEIKQTCNIAANQAAELFTQETYKSEEEIDEHGNLTGRSTGVTNMPDIEAPDGSIYINGDFYVNDSGTVLTNIDDIWNYLYGSNSSFKRICDLTKGSSINLSTGIVASDNSTVFNTRYEFAEATDTISSDKYFSGYNTNNQMKCMIKELGQLYASLYETSTMNYYLTHSITYQEFKNNDPIVKNKSLASGAQKMKNNFYTPVNIGFPYFDPKITNRIFRWDLATVLTGGHNNSIKYDENGIPYINYKGFRCYAQDAHITNFKYYILDREDANGRSRLAQLTNILDPSTSIGSLTNITNESDVNNRTNNYVVVVGIEYTIPIAYEGITPIKNIFEFMWDNEVNGNQGSIYNSVTTANTHTGTGQYSYATQNMSNSTGNNGVLETSSSIYYVLVR